MNALLPLIFVVSYAYAIVKSKRKVRAAILPLSAIAIVMVFGVALAALVRNQAAAIGTMTGLITMLTGIFSSLFVVRHLDKNPR